MNKIAFLIPSLERGGAERQLVNLVKALDKKDFDITVLCFYPDGPLEKDLEHSGVKIISLEKRGRWDIFSFLGRLIHQLKHLQPNVLHGYLSEPNLVMIFIKPFFPSIQMIWGVRASELNLSHYDWLARLLFPLECFLSRFADLIIFNSHAGRTYHLAHGFPANKAVVIPNGIDTERFKPDSEARVKIRSEWGISEETVLIGLVGRLDRMKDHPTFLKAAALLCQERQDIGFVCVGSGAQDYAQELYHLAEQLNIAEKVIWTGTRADTPAVYNALDIASSSSSSEGFANVIGEAMACGISCVVTDVGDSAWIVGDVGIVG
ncbi:MAG TPA: group 1 glycosyl transferase, partial [Cyanobacteria bacterium UBA8553]|nr:group 1 glycosyl transferase [Cyanobacteria bacterium UBA8553]